MPSNITVPDMGESVIEATVSRWLKQEGEAVKAGEPLVELETDKINLEVGAQQAGVLQRITKGPGETVAVGDVLGIVAAEGEGSIEAAPTAPVRAPREAPPAVEPSAGAGAPAPGGARHDAPQQGTTQQAPAQDTPYQAAGPEAAQGGSQQAPAAEGRPEAPAFHAAEAPDVASAATAGEAEAEGQPASDRVTPVARRMAQEMGVDLAQVRPSGSGGRITKEDVQAFAERIAQSAATTPAPQIEPPVSPAPRPASAPVGARRDASQGVEPTSGAGAPTPEGAPREAPLQGPAAPRQAAQPTPDSRPSERDVRPVERIRMSRRRQTIARRLVEAQQTAAMLTTFNEVDMSAVMNLRKRRREAFKERYGVDLGFMPFFIKASIGALKAFPNVNAELQGEELVLKRYYDIGIAVGAAEGLVVPVLRNADQLSFAEIEKAIRDFVTRSREGTLTLDDLRGGTFTITNGGVYGSLLSTPILNPPQVGILGMHAIKERPVVVEGQIVARPMMYVALSYDHRVVDGREAVQFLVRLKELIEDPEALLFA